MNQNKILGMLKRGIKIASVLITSAIFLVTGLGFSTSNNNVKEELLVTIPSTPAPTTKFDIPNDFYTTDYFDTTFSAAMTAASISSGAKDFLTDGNYYLDENYTLDYNVFIKIGVTINICLNGYVLDMNGHQISNNGILRIYDFDLTDASNNPVSTVTEDTKTHKFAEVASIMDATSTAHNVDNLWALDESSGSHTVSGGVITGGGGAGKEVPFLMGGEAGTEISGGSTLEFYGVKFVGNTSIDSFDNLIVGTSVIQRAKTTKFEYCEFSNNVIYNSTQGFIGFNNQKPGGQVTLNNVKFYDNYINTTSNMAGVFLNDKGMYSCAVTVTNIEVTNNKITTGVLQGLINTQSTSLTLDANTKMSENTITCVRFDGGLIRATGNVNISGNYNKNTINVTASSGEIKGGIIAVSNTGYDIFDLKVLGATISENIINYGSNNGQGVFIYSGNMTQLLVSDSTINKNKVLSDTASNSRIDGGFIYGSNKTASNSYYDVKLLNTTISENTVLTSGYSFGGLVYSNGKLYLESATISENNISDKYYNVTNPNSTYTQGALLYTPFNDYGLISLDKNTKVTKNTIHSGFFIEGGLCYTRVFVSDDDGTTGTLISENTVIETKEDTLINVDGGFVYCGYFTLKGTIKKNSITAKTEILGGFIYAVDSGYYITNYIDNLVYGGDTAADGNTVLINSTNVNEIDGAFCCIYGNANLEITNLTLKNNTAITPASYDVGGGTISRGFVRGSTWSPRTVTITDSTFDHNVIRDKRGIVQGGIVSGYDVTVTNSDFTYNEIYHGNETSNSTHYVGGIVYGRNSVTLTEVDIDNNTFKNETGYKEAPYLLGGLVCAGNDSDGAAIFKSVKGTAPGSTGVRFRNNTIYTEARLLGGLIYGNSAYSCYDDLTIVDNDITIRDGSKGILICENGSAELSKDVSMKNLVVEGNNITGGSDQYSYDYGLIAIRYNNLSITDGSIGGSKGSTGAIGSADDKGNTVSNIRIASNGALLYVGGRLVMTNTAVMYNNYNLKEGCGIYGLIFAGYSNGYNKEFTITDCDFNYNTLINNDSSSSTSLLYFITNPAALTMTNVNVSNNIIKSLDNTITGAITASGGRLTATNLVMESNYIGGTGIFGGLYYTSNYSPAQTTFIDCRFNNNDVVCSEVGDTGIYGGLFYSQNGQIDIKATDDANKQTVYGISNITSTVNNLKTNNIFGTGLAGASAISSNAKTAIAASIGDIKSSIIGNRISSAGLHLDGSLIYCGKNFKTYGVAVLCNQYNHIKYDASAYTSIGGGYAGYYSTHNGLLYLGKEVNLNDTFIMDNDIKEKKVITEGIYLGRTDNDSLGTLSNVYIKNNTATSDNSSVVGLGLYVGNVGSWGGKDRAITLKNVVDISNNTSNGVEANIRFGYDDNNDKLKDISHFIIDSSFDATNSSLSIALSDDQLAFGEKALLATNGANYASCFKAESKEYVIKGDSQHLYLSTRLISHPTNSDRSFKIYEDGLSSYTNTYKWYKKGSPDVLVQDSTHADPNIFDTQEYIIGTFYCKFESTSGLTLTSDDLEIYPVITSEPSQANQYLFDVDKSITATSSLDINFDYSWYVAATAGIGTPVAITGSSSIATPYTTSTNMNIFGTSYSASSYYDTADKIWHTNSLSDRFAIKLDLTAGDLLCVGSNNIVPFMYLFKGSAETLNYDCALGEANMLYSFFIEETASYTLYIDDVYFSYLSVLQSEINVALSILSPSFNSVADNDITTHATADAIQGYIMNSTSYTADASVKVTSNKHLITSQKVASTNKYTTIGNTFLGLDVYLKDGEIFQMINEIAKDPLTYEGYYSAYTVYYSSDGTNYQKALTTADSNVSCEYYVAKDDGYYRFVIATIGLPIDGTGYDGVILPTTCSVAKSSVQIISANDITGDTEKYPFVSATNADGYIISGTPATYAAPAISLLLNQGEIIYMSSTMESSDDGMYYVLYNANNYTLDADNDLVGMWMTSTPIITCPKTGYYTFMLFGDKADAYSYLGFKIYRLYGEAFVEVNNRTTNSLYDVADGNYYGKVKVSQGTAPNVETKILPSNKCNFYGYTITYDSTGVSGNVPVDTYKYKKGEQATALSTSATLNGGNIIGWATTPSATSATYDFNDDIVINGNLTLYPVSDNPALQVTPIETIELPSEEKEEEEKEKKTYDMSNAGWDYSEAFIYDGSIKAVNVIGLPSGVSITSIRNNKNREVGTYTASVTLAYNAEEYEAPYLADLTWEIKKIQVIEPQIVGITEGSTPETSEIEKTPEEKTPEEETTLDEDVEKETKPQSMYKYSGKEMTLVVSGVEDFMTTSDTFTQKEVGHYTITYTLTDPDHYEWADGNDGIVEWDIFEVVEEIEVLPSEEEIEKAKNDVNYTPRPAVKVSMEEGLPSVLALGVEVTHEKDVESKGKNGQLTLDYYDIKQEDKKLKNDEKVGVIYDIKLLKDGNEVQPEEFAPGEKVKVQVLIPDNVDISRMTKIMHVHSKEEIEIIDFDITKLKDGYFELEVTNFSEFAFVYAKTPEEIMASYQGFTISFSATLGAALLAILVAIFIKKKHLLH